MVCWYNVLICKIWSYYTFLASTVLLKKFKTHGWCSFIYIIPNHLSFKKKHIFIIIILYSSKYLTSFGLQNSPNWVKIERNMSANSNALDSGSDRVGSNDKTRLQPPQIYRPEKVCSLILFLTSNKNSPMNH